MSLWYERSVIYEFPPALFKDGNGDGFGDFVGAVRTLDYLVNLGVNCLWLQPFFLSPRQDFGYDVADYYRVDPRFGDAGDFVRFLGEAEGRGLHVIIGMPFQHTSDRHPWFQEARHDPDSPYRDYYIWSDEPRTLASDAKELGRGDVWTYDDVAGQYYHHSYYRFQPDLNLGNPALRGEFQKILHYWLQLGVSGFRLDAVPHMVKRKGRGRREEDLFDLIGDLRDFVTEKGKDAVLVGEVDTEPSRYTRYFGRDGERLRVILNFYLPGHAFLAFARKSAEPLRRVLRDLPAPPRGACYANFLRNHDELDLERLNAEERDEVLRAFAPDEHMRFRGDGIRRRLAPMLDDDPRILRLAHSLLLSWPGVPVLYYGDEIGMGEDLALHGRHAVRTPMQWTDEPNAGFSAAARDACVHPPISGGAFGFEARNVAEGRLESDSLLNWTNRLIRARRDCPEFGLAEAPELLSVGNDRVLAHRCREGDGVAMALHNLSDEEVVVDLGDHASAPLEVISDRRYERVEDDAVRLGPYGFRWFRFAAFHTPSAGAAKGGGAAEAS